MCWSYSCVAVRYDRKASIVRGGGTHVSLCGTIVNAMLEMNAKRGEEEEDHAPQNDASSHTPPPFQVRRLMFGWPIQCATLAEIGDAGIRITKNAEQAFVYELT